MAVFFESLRHFDHRGSKRASVFLVDLDGSRMGLSFLRFLAQNVTFSRVDFDYVCDAKRFVLFNLSIQSFSLDYIRGV